VPSSVTLNVDVQVQSGPRISYSLVESVEGQDLTEWVIPKGNTPAGTEVNVQPANLNKIQLVAITADSYAGIKYKTKEGTAAGDLGDEIILDAPHLFFGAGAVALLKKAPKSVVFFNTSAADIRVTILVIRKATI
jgi:hypothetical protein